MTALAEPLLAHASRSLPRYTSYPTALGFKPAPDDTLTRSWLDAISPTDALSIYVHIPFCERLCWYCGCHTSVPNGYDRIAAFVGHLARELDLWADALPPHAGAAHVHFGGGSPNSLATADFTELMASIARRFMLRPGAEVAVELDPGHLDPDFARGLGAAGVTRASLGVQTFDPEVQRRVNRVQPFEGVEAAVGDTRRGGVEAINFDMMYGLPGQTPDNVATSMATALLLSPNRVALFGYAHVPWMKKHQAMIRAEDLADVAGRWNQAEAAEAVLLAHGYVRIGMDHYAHPGDPMVAELANGGLRRNFQGYTDDPAALLIGLGPSAISAFPQGFAQNASRVDHWAAALESDRLPVARQLATTDEDRLRAAAIERLMCDLEVDVGSLCREHGYAVSTLDEDLESVRALAADGLCTVSGRQIHVSPHISRLVRVVAACFDHQPSPPSARHSLAV
ncbi:MAG: oxygen-independent coproporphyrinogen III oxidase [Brevundimonas sp.]|uniref:oxygen-independent coproporphyrinogen III oxidase n=1 Tax=Brevundimonas sp. TaxID=1871086 RepID=UPI00271D7D80|nr:oxygen-independent coproporphyrinogen III oxidase [Brevundimonas sp.]MDO9587005.1 oxygen-independent coproporphyrinogen III oxidase [Brevundimonas sp.]